MMAKVEAAEHEAPDVPKRTSESDVFRVLFESGFAFSDAAFGLVGRQIGQNAAHRRHLAERLMRVSGGWRGAGKPREENGQTLEREALAAKHPPAPKGIPRISRAKLRLASVRPVERSRAPLTHSAAFNPHC